MLLGDLGLLNKVMGLVLNSSRSIVDSAQIQYLSNLRLNCGVAISSTDA